MSRAERIEKTLKSALNVDHLELINQSAAHGGHYNGDGESHYSLLVVSSNFAGKSRINRQRLINDLLKEEWQNGLHALAIKAHSPDEL